MFESHSVRSSRCWIGDIEGSYPFDKWRSRGYYVPMNVPAFRSLLSREWHCYSSLWPSTAISQTFPQGFLWVSFDSEEVQLALEQKLRAVMSSSLPKHPVHGAPLPTHPSSAHICHNTVHRPHICHSFNQAGFMLSFLLSVLLLVVPQDFVEFVCSWPNSKPGQHHIHCI